MSLPIRLPLVLLIASLLAFVGAPETPAATPASAFVPGDADCDNTLTIRDALALLSWLGGTQEPTGCEETRGDLTCDGRTDQGDLIEVLFALAGVPRSECGGQLTVFGQLAEALEQGQITDEEAALYSVFAAFDDPRLPDQFGAGMPNRLEMPVDMALIGSQMAGFSPGVRAQLAPFFIAPMHEGSWWDHRYNGGVSAAGADGVPGPILEGEWSSVTGETAQVRLWYPRNDFAMLQLANRTAEEIDAHIWPKLTGLMGRGPLPDGGSFMPGRGGDDRLDIIISNDLPTFGALGLAPNWCERTSALLFADPGRAEDLGVPFHIGLAHELMHAILFSYDLHLQPGGNGGCSDTGYTWWHEATATWSEHFLYPSVNTEHTGPRGNGNVMDFIGNLGDPLDSGGDRFRGTNLGRPYGAYLWAFFVAHEYGDQIIRQMWENMQSESALDAMDDALPGGFKLVWPEFVVATLNRAPFDVFRQWDGVQQEPNWIGSTFRDFEERVALNTYVGMAGIDRDGDFYVDWLVTRHLSATVNSYKVTDENVRSVTFYNGFAYNVVERESEVGRFFAPEFRPDAEIRGLKVEALIKIAGQEWIREDWTFFPARTFCRDVAAERIEEVVIIVTNSVPEKDYKIDSPPDLQGPKAFISDMGCWRWEGSATSVYRGEGDSSEVMTTTVRGLVLERDPSQVFPFLAPIGVNYLPTAGTMDWSYTGSLGFGCSVSGSETGLALVNQHSLQTTIDVISGPFHRAAAGTFYPQQTFLPYTLSCTDSPPEQLEHFAVVAFPVSAEVEAFKVEDGSVISGSMHLEESNTEITWHFEAQRE